MWIILICFCSSFHRGDVDVDISPNDVDPPNLPPPPLVHGHELLMSQNIVINCFIRISLSALSRPIPKKKKFPCPPEVNL